MLPSHLVTPGSIWWLTDPFKNLESEDSDDEPPDLNDTFNGVEIGLLGHPVMVLHTLDDTTNVAVCLLTTLRGRDLEDRKHTSKYRYNHEFYLAVHPTEPPCPFLYPQLRLVRDLRLRKSCYLSIRRRYTIPLDMLEHYDRKRPNRRYQLTAKSFATVAETFSMKFPRPISSSCDGDSSTQSLCNVPSEPTAEEKTPAMTHGEPDLVSEESPLAKIKPSVTPPSENERDSRITPTSYILASPPSMQENDATCMGPLLSSGGCKAMVSAGITDVVLKTVEKSKEFMHAFRTPYYEPET